ncbi:hypothetical protein PHLGIDRAFT_63560 [Phlebiopsis gigantea 11061_1 CR5-6]|uniref:HhH-GPD domain-containing protein n=1 Tax=Phlebiopsis gigantea (strain 11061_1 CR5-6) TaxID=745531 RepID=A0A0C3SDA2_PHLG1|nr:hypothetical protein PHLGIDRAFT_63560 [Phlebiopsis gigantea 11061_1 CR5-6]
MVPAELTFSFEDAKEHLIKVDSRFEDIFDRLGCRPFEQRERVDPFRTLTQSILGQQISWLAARSITHRFIRLFDPSIPEKVADYDQRSHDSFFPAAEQVAALDIPTLRSAGLSQRKAEYIQDLASRFADGRLSTEKVLDSEDEELYEMLIAVRGIGRSTCLRCSPSAAPTSYPSVRDLGVQRGLLRWFLALHLPHTHSVQISPLKLPKMPSDEAGPAKAPAAPPADEDTLPVLTEAGALSVAPAPRGKGKKAADADADGAGVLPPAFTPSINRTLNMVPRTAVPPLPRGLTVAQLKTRLEKKTKIKGAFLTPQEMEELTAPWRPYRSIGVYYMWALAEDK